ncbi:hypothetical protein K1719_018372 [Acacia pycnantha]|nr:hypothetical protein K1719_018372 [Acacia pycnantha]
MLGHVGRASQLTVDCDSLLDLDWIVCYHGGGFVKPVCHEIFVPFGCLSFLSSFMLVGLTLLVDAKVEVWEFLLLLIGHVNGKDKAPLASIHEDVRHLLGEKSASLIWAATFTSLILDGNNSRILSTISTTPLFAAIISGVSIVIPPDSGVAIDSDSIHQQSKSQT